MNDPFERAVYTTCVSYIELKTSSFPYRQSVESICVSEGSANLILRR